ncbi:MAG: hypothetical protein K8U57_18080 [Planctomycetes bacterium]|nr:hypothetical protein [Planctomycetota bacterium]
MNTERRQFLNRVTATAAGLGLSGVAPAADGDVRIDADFLGGNVVVGKIDGTTVHIAPDLRDTQKGQWWFYWCFRLRAPAGKAIRVVFTDRNPIGVRGPAVSEDGGKTWAWLGAKAVRSAKTNGKEEWSFDARVPEGKEEVRYAFCIPYLESHLTTFRTQFKDHPALKVEELCKSRKGRSVELVRAGCLVKPRGSVILTSRHHACETMATYAMEGLLRAVLGDDDLGRRWRANWEVLAIPFMDKDGVEAGDQGKNRAPHDHNRDYNEKPIYPEVAALMKLGTGMAKQVRAAIDLHCPYISGEWNDRVYLVGSSDETVAGRQRAFAKVLERVQAGPIKFRARDCLEFGTAWNTKNNITQGRPSSNWATEAFPDAQLVTTIEIAYADALGQEVNADSARALGRDLAASLAEVLTGKE